MTAFLETASIIARRICRDAIWADGVCNWVGPAVVSPDMWDIRQKSYGPELYSGTAGVALFLASVASTAPEPMVRKTAEGALRHAYAHAAEIPPNLRMGVYSGRLGIAWTLLRVAELLGDETWKERGIDLLESAARDRTPVELDLISGCAGAIPVLIELSRRCARPAWTELAVEYGEQLEHAAVTSAEGCSWKTMESAGPLVMRNLTGFSHGAAGISWALLELSEATGEQRFCNAAEGGFQYERSHYSAEHKNWPDFRSFLRPPGTTPGPIFGSAWCHGAPGIALSRLRAFSLSGNGQARDEAVAALETTKRIVDSPEAAKAGFSLCHGCAGNADVLLEAERELGGAELRLSAERAGYFGIEQFEAQRLPWPCGLPGAGETNNLMLGTAGIGYFYLRLANPAVPTVLMIGPDHGASKGPNGLQ